MILAHLAGIKVFATGGLGGVHRGVESSMDISADLTEFGRTPVAVISAGCKGFLDIPRTLEYLETEGASVATFADGRTGDVKFPAFWSRESPSMSPMTVQDERQAASMIREYCTAAVRTELTNSTDAQSLLKMSSGLLFANPVPETQGIPPEEMGRVIEEALAMAEREGVSGAANTPFVLNAIKELSGGKSVTANRALIEANVIRGTKVAVELSKLESGVVDDEGDKPSGTTLAVGSSASVGVSGDDEPQDNANPHVGGRRRRRRRPTAMPDQPTPDSPLKPADVAVIGSVALDLACDFAPAVNTGCVATPIPHTSNPATITTSVGGVGYNVAKAVSLAGGSSVLCTVVGDDAQSGLLENLMQEDSSFTVKLLNMVDQKTAQYVAINDTSKNLVFGVADMHNFDDIEVSEETAEGLAKWLDIPQPKWLVADANFNSKFLAMVLNQARGNGTLTAFEPVSTAKAVRLFQNLLKERRLVYPEPLVDLATPNALELTAMYTAARDAQLFERQDWWQVIDALGISSGGARVELAMATSSELVDQGVPQQTIQLLPFVPRILTKLGADGVLLTMLLPKDDTRLSSQDAAPHILARSKTGGEGVGGVYMRLFPVPEAVKPEDVVSVNGVGDTFLGVLMAALTKKDGVLIENAVDIAQRASALTLKSRESVSPDITSLKLPLEML